MKKLYLILLLFVNGYFYHDGCVYTPQMVNCVDKGSIFPSIARFQKIETIGKTDSSKRWIDAVDCGSKYGDENLIYINDNDLYAIFHSCMIKKGYKRFHPAECGYQNPKWDKGVCNL